MMHKPRLTLQPRRFAFDFGQAATVPPNGILPYPTGKNNEAWRKSPIAAIGL
jgi:hypothetical protein